MADTNLDYINDPFNTPNDSTNALVKQINEKGGIGGGGSSGITIADTDGHSVDDATSLVITGGTVGGSTPNATLDVSGGGGGGLVLISNGIITSPESYLDVAIPAGYTNFLLYLMNLTLHATNSNLNAIFSADGGSSFYNDIVNADTYNQVEWVQHIGGSFISTATAAFGNYLDLQQVTGDLTNDLSIDASIQIYPGDSSHSLRMISNAVSVNSVQTIPNDIHTGFSNMIGYLNSNATNPPTYARVNLIRIGPNFSGGNTPAVPNQITAGSWALFGIPPT